MKAKTAKRTTAARAAIVLVAGLAATLVMLAGCAKEHELAAPNLEPQTYLAIADSVRHETLYNQTLRWWGEDKDGEVVAYEYRWFIDPAETGCRLDTLWVRTTATSKSFDLPVSSGASVHVFEVRAVDNAGATDPTPSRLRLPVINRPPEVQLWGVDIGQNTPPPDTTFPAFLAKWHGSDPEGDSTVAKYVVWLDAPGGGRESTRELAARDTVVSLGLEDFNARYDRFRTLSVVAVDAACDSSAPATFTWFVKQPVGRILLVDDKSSGTSDGFPDKFYRSGLDSCGLQYSVLDLARYMNKSHPGKGTIASNNFPELFPMFDLVIWYNSPEQPAPSARLTAVEEDLKAHIEDGGSLLLASLTAIGSSGALRDSIWPEAFGVDSIVTRDGSTNLGCQFWDIRGESSQGLDSLKVNGIFQGVDCFLPAATATPLYFIPPGTPFINNPQNYYVGIMNSWHTGKAALLTFPLERCTAAGNRYSEYCKVLHLLLN
jgi:hypothetical protein